MDKEIVIVVPSETAAYEVVKALKALDDQGSIELYASTVVTKGADGKLAVKDSHHLRAPLAAAIGLPVAAMLALLGGPLGAAAGATVGIGLAAGASGVAAGAAAGAVAGAGVGGLVGSAIGGVATFGTDVAYSGLMGDFVHAVAARLQPGTCAVLASVWEDWTVPIDTATSPYATAVFRQATDDVVAAQIKAEWQETKDELAHLEAEIKTSVGAEKAKLEAKRDELRRKQADQREKLQARVRKLQESWDAKIASMKSKAEAAKAEAHARHEQHARKLSHFAATQKQAFHDLFS